MLDVTPYKKYKIPVVINITAILVISILYFLLLLLASKQQHWYGVLCFACLFGILMIPLYTLIHEGEHGILHNSHRVNYVLGCWLGCLFIAPFSFIKHCHLRHHKKNRTDVEMWDLYYEHQDKWKRYGNLYFIMVGFGYLGIVLSVPLFSFAHQLVYSRLFTQHTETAGFLQGSNDKRKIRIFKLESIVVILFHVASFYIFNFDWKAWLCCYLVHGFIWSSQNYVSHAFSPRDIINGAHNLSLPRWLNLVYLNFNLHLVHHQNPKIPWIHLSAFINRNDKHTPFFENYIRLWKGPILTNEPDPSKLHHTQKVIE
jgi:fatty acid desaturase